jgi:hypothetical protein
VTARRERGYNGTVYQGREFQQTDAGFSPTGCCDVLSLESVSDGDGPALVLAGIDCDVRETIGGLLDERDIPHESATRDADSAPVSAVRLFETVPVDGSPDTFSRERPAENVSNGTSTGQSAPIAQVAVYSTSWTDSTPPSPQTGQSGFLWTDISSKVMSSAS